MKLLIQSDPCGAYFVKVMRSIPIVKEALKQDPEITTHQRKAALAILTGKTEQPTDQTGKSILLTRVEAAELLGCSQMTIYRLVKDGKLEPVKLREKNRYRRVDLEKIAGLH